MITGLRVGQYELTLVVGEGIPHVFKHVQDQIEEALLARSFNEWGVEELYDKLVEGEAQLWLAGENGARVVMVGVTRIIKYPCVRRVAIDMIVGEDLEGCIPMMEVVANWAKQYGCTEIEAACRPGVRKVMEKHGFTKLHEVIVKPISGSVN